MFIKKRELAPLIVVASIGVVFRAIIILFLSGDHISQDFLGWIKVVEVLRRGGNPYAETTFLNWPPAWVSILFLADRFSIASGIHLRAVLQAIFVSADFVAALLAGTIMIRWLESKRAAKIVLFGLALNPGIALIVCLSANFDPIVDVLILLFLGSILKFEETRDSRNWYVACVSLGTAILFKTFPIVLIPLLARGLKKLPRRRAVMGLALMLVLPVLGTALIYALDPGSVSQKVIGYVSVPGYFGVSGILHIIGGRFLSDRIYPGVFYTGLMTVLVVSSKLLREAPVANPRVFILMTATLLLGLPVFGPGYGTHYNYWAAPLLVMIYEGSPRYLKRGLVIYAALASVTLFIQYATDPGLGAFGEGHPLLEPLINMSARHPRREFITVLSLPLFLSMLWTFGCCVRALRTEVARDRFPSTG